MKKIFLTAIAVVLVFPFLVMASELGGGPSYTLPVNQTVDGNLYAGGGTVTVLGSVTKDMMVGGGTVTINGSTTANVMAAGGNINVSGSVGQDLRVAGGTVLINSPLVGGELVGAGGTIKITEGVRVVGDVYLAGGQVEIDGTLDGEVRIAGEEVVINGVIGPDVFIRAKKLTIGPNAVIGGDLNYRAETVAQIDPTATIVGETNFTEIKISADKSYLAMVGWALMKFIAYAVAALVIYFIFRRHSKDVAVLSTERFWKELLRGLIVLVVMPVAIILLFVTIIGWMVALIALFIYILALLLASVFSIFTMTGVLQKYVFKKASSDLTWPMILLGAFVLSIIGWIPIIGSIVVFLFFLSALGALSNLNFVMMRERQSEEEI